MSDIQPLISRDSNTRQVSKPKFQKGWFALVLIVTAIFCVSAVYHKQIGNILGLATTSSNSGSSWMKIEDIEDKYLSTKWSYEKECDDDEEIVLTFAVRQQNLDKIDDELMKVSDPTSENYGNHWSYEQIHEFLRPSEKAVNKIIGWLNNFDISKDDIEHVTPNSDFLRVTTTVETANRLLNTQYGYWKHQESGKSHRRVKEDYSVPEEVADHLDFISPTVRFPVESHVNKMELIGGIEDEAKIQADTTYVTPSTLKSLYSLGTVKGGLSTQNSQAVASFLEEWFNDDDLEQFWSFFDIDMVDYIRVPDTQPEGYGSEAELDVQYITSTGEGVTTLVWDIEDDLYFITLLQQIADYSYTPSVVSMSYGGDEQAQGWGYCNRANIEFAKVGLLGITFFASSGDSGAVSSSSGGIEEYTPSFPASSPYVTAVGGTTGGSSSSLEADDFTGETAWYYSGGGFSKYFEAKSFQLTAVDNYFDTIDADLLPDNTLYNRKGAAYPDLSAQSVAYVICYEGGYYAVSGTSCSCPAVAGMFALINDYRLVAGKTRLGWVNPVLYSLYDDLDTYFNDIVEGYNEGFSSDNDDEAAFYANTKWDPITGMGTPKFEKLMDAFFKVGTTTNENEKSIFKYIR